MPAGMVHALALRTVPAIAVSDRVRSAFVLSCAAALILAGKALPF
ncbi:hypothetical protein [Novosphingobium huizhouense]|nr:hypothetical protein [Novosphingobium huizhouense]